MQSKPSTFWFPAKRYGWGWGVPTCWQGWTVIAIYCVLIGAGAIYLRPDHTPVAFAVFTAAASVLLVLVCWWKGEPPRWRWGKD